MIQAATEYDHPKAGQGSILVLELQPKPTESFAQFAERIKAIENGVHQMEFKILGPGRASLKIELNPQWEVTEEHDDLKNVSDAELLREFEETATGRHDNKLDYGGK